jgi:hypothetical protein
MSSHQWTKQPEAHLTIFAEEGGVTVSVPVVISPVQSAEASTFEWIMKRDWKVQRMQGRAGNRLESE